MPNVRIELAHEYVKALNLELVSEEYFYGLACSELEEGRYVEAAICIANSSAGENAKFAQRFDIQEICVRLIMDLNKTQEAKLLLNLRPDLRVPLIESISTPQ